MSFLSRLLHSFGRFNHSTAQRHETVVFDDTRIVRTMRNGSQEILPWSELEEVSIITTDEGPFANDLYWVLLGTSSGCAVPSDAEGTQALLVRLQELPGFNNEAVIQAMGSIENAKFVCWSQSDAR